MPWSFNGGPIAYDGRKGQWKVTTKHIRYTGLTRAQKAKIKARRAAERQRIRDRAVPAKPKPIYVPPKTSAVADLNRARRERAGECGQKTADGTLCRRLGKCPPGYHRPTTRKKVTTR